MSAGEIIITVIGAAGGSGILVAGLGALLGKVWATRIQESDKAKFSQALERLRSDLELARVQRQRISEAQFKLYNEVWFHLQDLKLIGDQLWNRATLENVKALHAALSNAHLAVNRGRLILAESHYQDLMRVLSEFDKYELGKTRLIEIRNEQELEASFNIDAGTGIREQIAANSAVRERYEALLGEVVDHFRSELGLADRVTPAQHH